MDENNIEIIDQAFIVAIIVFRCIATFFKFFIAVQKSLGLFLESISSICVSFDVFLVFHKLLKRFRSILFSLKVAFDFFEIFSFSSLNNFVPTILVEHA